MFDFGASPSAVVEDFKTRKPELHFDYDEIMHETHARVFSVAKLMKMDLLKSVQESLAKASKNGIGFEKWKEEVIPTLKKEGWFGRVQAIDDRSGEVKDIYVGSRRLKNIYNTNMRTTYARARYERQIASGLEYFRYISILDSATRPKHRQWHGLILRSDDPFWDKNYPPNDWGCRCSVNAYSKEQIEAKGWKVGKAPSVDIASSDFSYSPSRNTEKLKGLISERLKELKRVGTKARIINALQEELSYLERSVWEKGLKHLVDEAIIKENLKDPLNVVQVGFLSKTLSILGGEILGKEVKSGGIILTKKELTHASPKRKASYDHALRIDEIRRIPEVLADEGKAYVDLREKKQNIVFIFDDEKDDSRVNLIPIEISKIHKKFGQSNYVITLDKAKRENIIGLIRSGFLRRIKGAGGI